MNETDLPPIDTSKMVDCEKILASKAKKWKVIAGLCDAARRFVAHNTWCGEVKSLWYDPRFDKYVAVFYAELTVPEAGEHSAWLVVGGNLPPAIVPDDNRNGADALDEYCLALEQWARLKGKVPADFLIDVLRPDDYAPILHCPEVVEHISWLVSMIRKSVPLKDQEVLRPKPRYDMTAEEIWSWSEER